MKKTELLCTLLACGLMGSTLSAQEDNFGDLNGFLADNIGSPDPGGIAEYHAITDSYLLSASSGSVIDNSTDELFFVHKTVSGDIEFVVQLAQLGASGPNAKAGIMLRSSLEPDSAYVSLFADYSVGAIVLCREKAGVRALEKTQVVNIGRTTHLAFIREGNLFSAYLANEADSLDWVALGAPFIIEMPQQIEGGVFVTSPDGATSSARFSELSLLELGTRDSLFVEQRIPTILESGEMLTGSLVFENKGSLPWLASKGFELAWVGSQPNPFGLDAIELVPGSVVKPGEFYVFNLNMRAPLTPGVYDFQWTMSQRGPGGFGGYSDSTLIEVMGDIPSGTAELRPYDAYKPAAFLEQNGEIAFEAEDAYNFSTGLNGETWQSISFEGASGSVLTAYPNANVNTFLSVTGARSDYYFLVENPGEYFLYVRGASLGGSTENNSIHAAVDDQVLTNKSGLGMSDFTETLGWRQLSGDPDVKVKATLSRAGVHKLSIWSREDGVIIDRLMLSTDGSLAAEYLDSQINSLPFWELDYNHQPVVNSEIPDQEALAGQYWSYSVSNAVFGDEDGDILELSALDLPDWLTFDGSTIRGIAPQRGGSYSITIRADDGSSFSDTSFDLKLFRYWTDAFKEQGGEVLFEAENYTSLTVGNSGESWIKRAMNGASGGVVQASPDVGVNTLLEATGAQADYFFRIQEPGEYYLYVRGKDPKGNSDSNSIHAAINEIVLENEFAKDLQGFTTEFDWQQNSDLLAAHSPVLLNHAGIHKLSIWSREDGVIIDRIALSKIPGLSASYLDSRANSPMDRVGIGGPSEIVQKPTLSINKPIGQLEGDVNTPWSFVIPADLFVSTVSDLPVMSALNLPDWLGFDGTTMNGTLPRQPGNHLITLRGSDGTSEIETNFLLSVNAAPTVLWNPDGIEIVDTTWCMLHLTWDNPWDKRIPVLLQRREDTAFTLPDLDATQSYDNFIWLGQGETVTRYKDLFNWQQAGKKFYYRITAVLNYSEVVNEGAKPEFASWKTGAGALDSLPANWNTYDVTQFGADPSGKTNSWNAIVAAVNAAKSTGGGRVYLPRGNYVAWPQDSNVKWDGRNLSINPGASAVHSMINGQTSNLVIEGEADTQGKPLTQLSLRLWHNRSGKDFLVVLNRPDGNPTKDRDIATVRRYGFWEVGAFKTPVENVQLRNIQVDMTAQPVNSGKDWQSLNGLRYQWDTSQKLVYGFHSARNILLENVVAKNIRGEICYWGGVGCEKYKLENVALSQSNSSIISMSADAEYNNVRLADAANALVESAPHSLNHDSEKGSPLFSAFAKGLRFYQDTIIRNLRGNALDQGPSGVMRHLPGKKNFAGIILMNQAGTFFSITDSSIEDFNTSGFAPWHETQDGFTSGLVIKNPTFENVRFIDFRPSPKVDYRLSGGMENLWMIDTVIELNRDLGNGSVLLYATSGLPSMNDVVIDGLHVIGNGHQLNRVWFDKYTSPLGRNNFRLSHWSHEGLFVPGNSLMVDLIGDGKRINPSFGPGFDFFAETVHVSDSNPAFLMDWPNVAIDNSSGSNSYSIRPSNLASLVVGQDYVIGVNNPKHQVLLPKNNFWNTFGQDIFISGNQKIRCKIVYSGGAKKLAFVGIE